MSGINLDVPKFSVGQYFANWKTIFNFSLPALLVGIPEDQHNQLKLSFLLRAGCEDNDFREIILEKIQADSKVNINDVMTELEKFFSTKESVRKFEAMKQFRELKNSGEDLKTSLRNFDSVLSKLKSLKIEINAMEKVMSFVQTLPQEIAGNILNRGLPLEYESLRAEAEKQLQNAVIFDGSTSNVVFAAVQATAKKCFRCGFDQGESHKCPAINSNCTRCGKIGHFKRMCSLPPRTPFSRAGKQQNSEYIELRDANGKIFKLPSHLISKYASADSNPSQYNYSEAQESACVGLEKLVLNTNSSSPVIFVDTGVNSSVVMCCHELSPYTVVGYIKYITYKRLYTVDK